MNNRGQFSIIAALLVAVILIATVIMTYSTIRNSPIQTQPQMLSAIDETNLAIKQILGFTVGYYGSVLQVTGNSSYAKMLALNYLQSGLVNIASMHPEWGTSFLVNSSNLYTCWFTNTSYSTGDLGITYNLTGLGISGIAYQTSNKLSAQIMNTTSITQACLNITKDEDEPLINLGKRNFRFYNYTYSNSSWVLINPVTEPTAFANGTYLIDIPSGVDPYSYIIQVEDPRGIIVVASSFSHYTCTLTWNSTMYSNLRDATLVMELWQNGTMRWLGQSLQLTTQAKPLPPIPVKALHVNQTANGVNSEVPFQVEDWTSDYRIPLGLTNNASVFSSRTMLVFLINSNISKVTIWWNGSDVAVQTSLAYTNKYFTVNTNSTQRTLNNTKLWLQLSFSDGTFRITSKMGTSTATAVLMRINNAVASYGSSEPMWAIVNGTVRVVLQHEVEWGGDGIPDCPNVYAHIVLTLPANATYYTYELRLMLLESTQSRNVADLCPIKITASSGTFSSQTENGTASGYPIVSTATGLFYNMSNIWAHHWTQLNSTTTKGFGVMFRDSPNERLYYFDSIVGNKTGALSVSSAERKIEFLPVKLAQVSNFTPALDIIWDGAVVTFDDMTPIYKLDGGNKTGLWIIVEYPPTVAVTTES